MKNIDKAVELFKELERKQRYDCGEIALRAFKIQERLACVRG